MSRSQYEIEKDISNVEMGLEMSNNFLKKYAYDWGPENDRQLEIKNQRMSKWKELKEELRECIAEKKHKEEEQELAIKEHKRKEQKQKKHKEQKCKEQKVENKNRDSLRKADGNVFAVEFLQSFTEELMNFDKICTRIYSEAKNNLLKMDTDYENEKEYLLKEYQENVNTSVSEKTKAFEKYETELKELNQTEASRHHALYAEIAKNKDNETEIQRLRTELFANEGEIKQKRNELWSEYKNSCEKILESRKAEQENTLKTFNLKSKKQEDNFQKSKEKEQSSTATKINAKIDEFTKKFIPAEINKEYSSIYADEPFEHYKNRSIVFKNIRLASLTCDLSTLNLGEHTKALLETHYPFLYRHKKLITPYCLNISKTNGICFKQSKENREIVYKTIQAYILKLLLQINPGLLKLTLYDGEGSAKNLIGLSHIDKRIKGENILTDQNELKRDLEKAVLGMNTTIQKVLGSKYADKNITEYNEENKGTDVPAEPYHVICITDFPTGLGKEHLELITKIVRSGKQAGVFIIMASDKNYVPKNSYDNMDIKPLLNDMGMKVIEDGICDNINLSLDSELLEPDELEKKQELVSTGLSEELKKGSEKSVEFDDNTLWKSDSCNGIKTPIGKMGVKEQYFTLSVEDGSSNTPHHCLIGGTTGSGKTVLLHNIICNTAWNYSPDEVQFILLDYKEGVGFKIYENLPHVKVLSIDSEREYGISVFEFIEKEIIRRGKLFKNANDAQDIAGYRKNTQNKGEKIPRLLIIIDEFQKLLDGDMRTTTIASKALDDISSRARSFGIHLILSTQSLIGVNIDGRTLSNIGLRIVLKLTERDCDYFLAQGNNEPSKELEKKGSAIYNAGNHFTEANVRFQVTNLRPEDIDKMIFNLGEKYKEVYHPNKPFKPLFYYNGSVSASIKDNKNIPKEYTPDYRKCKVYIGESVALEEEHSFYSLEMDHESNALMVGKDILAAMSIFSHSIQQIIKQSSDECKIYICNKVNKSNEHYSKLDDLRTSKVELLENDKEIEKIIETVFEEVKKREIESSKNRIILAFADIYNARCLRKNGHADSPLTQKLITILKDGPGFGIHCIVYASSFDNLKNILDVYSMLNEFNVRIELRGGDGYKIFQSNDVGIDKATPNNDNIANMQTPQSNGIRKIKVYGFQPKE